MSIPADIEMVGVHAPQKFPSLVNLNEGKFDLCFRLC